jgi:predicted RNA-binding Zn ribbon-like protein
LAAPSRDSVLLDTTLTGVDSAENTSYTGVMIPSDASPAAVPASDASRFLFLSGRLCLDFVHTGGAAERRVFEQWHTPSDLADWLATSPLRVTGIVVSTANLRTAHALREAIWHTALACLRRKRLPTAQIELINRLAQAPDLAPQLDGTTQRSVWHPSLSLSAALSTVARDAIALFASEQAHSIRQCANPQCLLLFVDASRPGKRRWCSMDRCGNRAKVSTYRRHRAQGHATGPQAE